MQLSPSFPNPEPSVSGSGLERKNNIVGRGIRALCEYQTLQYCSDETRGCNGFDGGVEAGIAGGCAYHP